MSKSWREIARPIIAQVLADTKGQPEQAIRKALKDAYPFGARMWHPYKVWLNEIKRQRFPLSSKKKATHNPKQQQLFQ